MKKLSLFILLVATIFISCSKDDDASTKTNKELIIGKWQLTSSTINGEVEALNECELKYTLEFLSNNVLNWVDPYRTQPNEPIGCIESKGTLFWTLVDNNTIYIKDKLTDPNEDPEKILELTDTTLKTQHTYQPNSSTSEEIIDTYKKI